MGFRASCPSQRFPARHQYRAVRYAAAVAGEVGVDHTISLLAVEVRASLGMLGLTRIDQLDPSCLMRRQLHRWA